MPTKSFAIPLNAASKQYGDISFKALVDALEVATFKLTYASSGDSDVLDLITKKNGTTKNHVFNLSFINNYAKVDISIAVLEAVFNDADGGDWDFVQAKWTLGGIDQGGTSNLFEIQDGRIYNSNGWPPVT